ncbi:M81 family metallopeptidase [Lutimaribacter saemankumensis]|uniref:Microcystinase C n=1 Tax=Lutimaribacter saemankumensis TaxID=490829 RepID=A0A1G8TTC2_9RHOB|nr:M81 family metallopeptidase [Lutimaribacter saemankumensis]SDJ43970.1 Microcystin degradation protein MlrC, contains DUF1485 domain [Lutimaribacter saemankumensis]
MKLFCATLFTESNCFVNLPTSLETFRRGHILPGACPTDTPPSGAEMMYAAKRRAATGAFDLIEGSCFRAAPAGQTSAEAYRVMRDQICDELRAALPVDGVILGMHGGMMVYGTPDAEGDFLDHVRAVVGPDVVIGVEFDLHSIVNARRLKSADVIVLYKEYPHTDMVEQADKVIDIVTDTIGGRLAPVASLYDCRQIDTYPTSAPEMRRFVEHMIAIEQSDSKVVSISMVHGFVYNDTQDLSTRILVYTNGDKAHGDALARDLGEMVISMRGRTASPLLSIDAAIDAALAAPQGPVVIADPTDNAGGGAPSDNTDILKRLIERDVRKVAFGPIWDPIAVRIAIDSGLGAEIDLRIGGKVARTSGTALDCRVVVTGIQRNGWQLFGSSHASTGESVALSLNGLDVVLTSERTQAFSPDLFSQVGIDVTERQAVFLKSVNHFMSGFGALAKQVLYVDGNGPLKRDYSKLTYRNVRHPYWPADEKSSGEMVF